MLPSVINTGSSKSHIYQLPFGTKEMQPNKTQKIFWAAAMSWFIPSVAVSVKTIKQLKVYITTLGLFIQAANDIILYTAILQFRKNNLLSIIINRSLRGPELAKLLHYTPSQELSVNRILVVNDN